MKWYLLYVYRSRFHYLYCIVLYQMYGFYFIVLYSNVFYYFSCTLLYTSLSTALIWLFDMAMELHFCVSYYYYMSSSDMKLYCKVLHMCIDQSMCVCICVFYCRYWIYFPVWILWYVYAMSHYICVYYWGVGCLRIIIYVFLLYGIVVYDNVFYR